MKKKNITKFIVAMLVLVVSVYVAAVGFGNQQLGSMKDIKLGLDLAGGVSITYQAKSSTSQTDQDKPSKSAIDDTIFKLKQRITDAGYTEHEVYPEGDNRINVDIPNVNDPEKILQELGKPGSLSFTNPEGAVVLTGEDIKDAQPQAVSANQSFKGGYNIELTMTPEGARKFAEATEKNIGKPIHIIYNGKTILSPTVQSVIREGKAQITGMNNEEAIRVASFIRIGALPLELDELRSNVVGAKMGQDVITTSLKAGAIGVCLIFLFMIIIYGVPGIAASLALVFYSSLVVIILSLTNITLTLGGIAGMILSVGMAVDANVIIFARIKEELNLGKTIKAALKAGFSKALSSIVDGNVTTLIAAFVLYIMGVGTIRGFAITLGLGILVSMFTALVITRIILEGFVAFGWKPSVKVDQVKELKIFKIVESKARFFILSIALIVLGLVFLPINNSTKDNPLNYDIEFAGGTSTMVSVDKTYNSIEELQADVLPLVQEATGEQSPQINAVKSPDGSDQFIIKTRTLDTNQRDKLNDALIKKFNITSAEIQSASIGATIGKEMRRNAITSVLIASFLMLLYIWFRFKDVSFGFAAIIALLHDVFIVFMVYSVFYVPINNSFIAAMLTIVGYSINDTIVIFDRIRENQHRVEHGNYRLLINTSISQMIGRSINTSITTVIMVLALHLMGTASIQELTLPLLVGIISGTYSSIFVASPIWYLFKAKYQKK